MEKGCRSGQEAARGQRISIYNGNAHLEVGIYSLSDVHGWRLSPTFPMASDVSIGLGGGLSNKLLITSVKNAISHARMATYETAARPTGDEDVSALTLYVWNARVSGALMTPLHICEVTVRNAVAEALENIYGPNWPWDPAMVLSLPTTPLGYDPRRDLINTSKRETTTGKVIPELKFVFWQRMFTKRHDVRLWNTQLKRVLPNLNSTKNIAELRNEIFDELEHVRMLRNRIAHHEPIFTRSLVDDFERIVQLIEYKCKITAHWMVNNQRATELIAQKP